MFCHKCFKKDCCCDKSSNHHKKDCCCDKSSNHHKKDCCCDKCKKDHKEIHCKVDKKLLKECICCEWTVPKGETQTVYQTAGFEKIIGSGFISFDDGQVPFILVTFFDDGHQVGETIKVFNDSCVAFTYTKFNRIKVSCPNLGNNSHPDHHDGCEGEICITTRFPV